MFSKLSSSTSFIQHRETPPFRSGLIFGVLSLSAASILGLAEPSFAAPYYQSEPVIAQMTEWYEAAQAPTDIELKLGESWECLFYPDRGVPNGFTTDTLEASEWNHQFETFGGLYRNSFQFEKNPAWKSDFVGARDFARREDQDALRGSFRYWDGANIEGGLFRTGYEEVHIRDGELIIRVSAATSDKKKRYLLGYVYCPKTLESKAPASPDPVPVPAVEPRIHPLPDLPKVKAPETNQSANKKVKKEKKRFSLMCFGFNTMPH